MIFACIRTDLIAAASRSSNTKLLGMANIDFPLSLPCSRSECFAALEYHHNHLVWATPCSRAGHTGRHQRQWRKGRQGWKQWWPFLMLQSAGSSGDCSWCASVSCCPCCLQLKVLTQTLPRMPWKRFSAFVVKQGLLHRIENRNQARKQVLRFFRFGCAHRLNRRAVQDVWCWK